MSENKKTCLEWFKQQEYTGLKIYNFLVSIGFVWNKIDQYLFIKQKIIILLIYVNNSIIIKKY